MHPDHIKSKNQRNNSKIKQIIAPDLEVTGEKCNTTKNSQDSYTEVTSVSSFTHDSQKERDVNLSIREQLAQKVNNKIQDVLQGIKNYDKLQTGKILPVNLYNVLRIFCLPLSLKEFNSLIKEEPFDENGFISYKPILSSLISDEKKFNSLWQNEENRTDVSALNTEELEIEIKTKISKNIKSFIRCIWLHDFNNDGLIQKEDLRTVIESICFPLTDDQFNRFWSLYDPSNSGVTNYKEFLLKLGTHAESYKRILPQDKKKHSTLSHSTKHSRQEQIQILCAKLGRDDPAIQGQFFKNILDVFRERVKKEFPLLMRTLQIKDSKGSGFIHLSVFHQVLNYFVMPMSYQLFKEILRSFNVSPNASKIAWYSFLKKVSVNSDVKCENGHTPLMGSVSWKICKSVLEKLKRNGKSVENFFKNAFTMPTPNHKMAVTRAELRKIINQSLILPLSEEEFKAMMFILDPGHTNFIDCDKFLCLFRLTNGDNESQNSIPSDDELLKNKSLNANLSGEKLKATFKKCFNKNFKNIEKALFAFDSEETGAINIDDFRKILDVFCFLLNDNQFFEIINSFVISNKIFYGDFINFYRKSPYEDEEKWKSCVTKLISPKVIPKQNLNSDDMIRFVQELILANKENFMREFKDYDLCNTGALRKEVFSKLLHKYVFRLTDEQFDFLWEKLPKNEIGFLKYEEFLNEWCSASNFGLQPEIKPPLSARSNSIISVSSRCSSKASVASGPKERPKTASSVMSMRSTNSTPRVNARPKSAASLTNLSMKSNSELSVHSKGFQNCSILTKQQYKQYKSLDFGKDKKNVQRPSSKTSIKSNRALNDNATEKSFVKGHNHLNEYERIIQTRWRDILRRCKQVDTEKHDVIPWEDFIGVLQRTGIDVNDETVKSLENKYNLRADFSVNYWIFLKKILLKVNSEQYLNAVNIKEWNAKQNVVSRHESVGLCKVLLNYRDKILKNYRDLYHAFRKVDPQRTGEISTMQFRKILTLYKIYMTDHDFFYIQDYFDPKLSEKIPYDKFLKSFAKN